MYGCCRIVRALGEVSEAGFVRALAEDLAASTAFAVVEVELMVGS